MDTDFLFHFYSSDEGIDPDCDMFLLKTFVFVVILPCLYLLVMFDFVLVMDECIGLQMYV